VGGFCDALSRGVRAVLCVRYRDRRIGKMSPRGAPTRELERMHELSRERYSDFTAKHFHEQPVKRHDCKLCYTVVKASPQAAGLRCGAHRIGSADRRRGCCSSRTARSIAGSPAWGAISISPSPSTIPPPGSVRHCWSSRKAQCRASSALLRRSPGSAYSGRSTPIAAATTSSPPRMPARSTRRSRPRSAARSPSSASPTSRPIRRRGAGAWSGFRDAAEAAAT
jgi:hypothetical protein